MKLDEKTKILIIGLGVIGGGYAEALTKAGFHVGCLTKDADDIAYALERGIIDYGTTEPTPELIGEQDLIIFALYPKTFVDWIKVHGHMIKKGTLITDVTGVKTSVVRTVQEALPDGVEFISAHPMAGRERRGVTYADAKVFLGANYIITPTEKNTKDAIDTCHALGVALGFEKISVLSPEEHDAMIAYLSQLTHCIAVTLMNSNKREGLEKYTGDSFRDLTRIAKINDEMWSELFMLNRDALLHEMDAFINEFTDFRNMLVSGDVEGMRSAMRESTERRALFDKKQ